MITSDPKLQSVITGKVSIHTCKGCEFFSVHNTQAHCSNLSANSENCILIKVELYHEKSKRAKKS